MLDANGYGNSHFRVTCNNEAGFTGNRIKLVKQCDVVSCASPGDSSLISGIAVFVSNNVQTGSCTPNDQSVLDGVPIITVSG